jgi:hypothetical protein
MARRAQRPQRPRPVYYDPTDWYRHGVFDYINGVSFTDQPWNFPSPYYTEYVKRFIPDKYNNLCIDLKSISVKGLHKMNHNCRNPTTAMQLSVAFQYGPYITVPVVAEAVHYELVQRTKPMTVQALQASQASRHVLIPTAYDHLPFW